MDRKFIFVTGGVLSSLGKGIFASSIAKILKSKHGITTSLMKIDPYLNTDAGTLNPFEHGEVFVTQDGYECDLDLGNYERYLNEYAIKDQNLMMGSVYQSVLDKERKGDYLGKTVQSVPHVTDEIKKKIKEAAKKTNSELLVVEIGGTVGDIESEIVLEAIRQMKFEQGTQAIYIHLGLMPAIITGEEKTKPLQHSIKALMARGITPDLVIARSTKMISKQAREKIAQQSSVRNEDVFCSPNAATIYKVPVILDEQKISERILEKLQLKGKTTSKEFEEWKKLVEKLENLKDEVKIAVVGKYAGSKDAYMSLFEALTHAGLENNVKVTADLLDAQELEKEINTVLTKYDGVIIPGGFGGRALEGKINAIKYCRENKVPLLGICYGFQMAVIETARNILGWTDAHTTECNPETSKPVIHILPDKKDVVNLGGTLRLGLKKTKLVKGSLASKIYSNTEIEKRFRHRYEMNPDYVKELEKAGITFSGCDEQGKLMKVLERHDHPFFFGVQYHPEFDSRLEHAEESFAALVKAAKANKK